MKKAIKKGDKYVRGKSTCIVMAYEDNYVMARFPGCIPCVYDKKTFLSEFTPIIGAKEKK